MTHPPHRLLTVLPLAALLFGFAHAADIESSPMTGGVQDFIEFTQIIPKMDDLLGNVFKIMTYMDVPGVADTIARLLSGVIALLTFGIAWFNYGFNKRVNFMGIDGSFNNMLLAAMTVLFISTGVPRLLGEAGWAVWRVTYTSVEQKVHPVMDKMIQERTQALAEEVWKFAVNGLSAGAQPMVTAAMYLKGDLDVTQDGLAGAPYREAAAKEIDRAQEQNDRYAGIWQLGSLLIAGMFMAYIGVIFGSGLFVIFAAILMPVAFALIPINSGLIWKQIGGMVSSSLVAGVAPGLMLVNVMLVFDVPLQYLTKMMKNQSTAAGDNANFTQQMISTCLNKATEGNPAEKLVAGVTDAVNPLNEVMENFCVVQLSGVQTLYTMGQAAVMMIVGLAVAGMLFIGLSGLSMMIFREFKGRVDDIFAGGGGLGNGSTGAASRAASAAGNRMLGAAIGAAGVMTGNSQLASAGARSVVSGNNALSGAAASMIERGRDNKLEQKRDAKAAEGKAEAKRERALENAERERASDQKYAERNAQRPGGAAPESGEGSRTDPRTAASGGQYAGQADGGAVAENPVDGRSTVPSGPAASREVTSDAGTSAPSREGSAGESSGPATDPRAAGSAVGSAGGAVSGAAAGSATGAAAGSAAGATTAASAAPVTPAARTGASPSLDKGNAPAAQDSDAPPPADPEPTQAQAQPQGQPGQPTAPTQGQGQAQPQPAAPSPVNARPVGTPAAYTADGNQALRQSGVSREERDEAAVLDYHKMLNAPSGGGEQAYISREQAQWDLARRGMLPSQRDENERLISEYARQNGVNERTAESTLKDSRQLVQFQTPTPPRPADYPSEEAERAAKNNTN